MPVTCLFGAKAPKTYRLILEYAPPREHRPARHRLRAAQRDGRLWPPGAPAAATPRWVALARFVLAGKHDEVVAVLRYLLLGFRPSGLYADVKIRRFLADPPADLADSVIL